MGQSVPYKPIKTFKRDLAIQCEILGSAIAFTGVDQSEGFTSFLKDRNDQLKREVEALFSESKEFKAQLKSQSLQLKELFSCIQELKHSTIKQFINKSHVELETNDLPQDIAYMIDIVQTITQIVK